MVGRRIILYLLVPAVVLLVAGLMVTQDFFGEQGVELGQAVTEERAAALPETAVYVEAEIYADVSDPDQLYLALTEATLPAVDGRQAADFFCLYGIYVTPALEPVDGVFYQDAPFEGQATEQDWPHFRLDPPLCNYLAGEDGSLEANEGANSDVIAAPEGPLALFLDEGERSIRFYPFDHLAGRWDIYALALDPAGALKPGIALDVHLTAELADWEERISLRPDALRFETSPTETFDWPTKVLAVELDRTRTQRLLTLTLLGFLTVLIMGLAFVKDKSTLLEIVIGVLLGLWGIQAVLIPGYIQNRTLVHYWVIILYIVLGLVAYVRLVGLPLVRGVDATEAIEMLDEELDELLEEELEGE